MSRALPLSDPDAQINTEGQSESTGPSVAGRIEVFDPPMCCPTGLCGPGVDPALLAISRDLRWLEKQGAQVVRVGLATEPQAFVASPRVSGLMQAFGDAALPATLVNGDVLTHGRYPTRDELVRALSETRAATPKIKPSLPMASGSCCEPGSDCC